MDLIVTNSDLSTTLADVTITHPNPSDNQVISPAMLVSNYFSNNRENTKRTKYGQAAAILGAKFVPLVLETYGSMGAAFSSFLNHLSFDLFRQTANSDSDTELFFKQRLKQLWTNRISVCFQIADARLILSKISRNQIAYQRHSTRLTVDFSGASGLSI